ncbi:TonB-dependent receptor [Aquabacterium sp.]|uniref:TonB-dependent receptor n=1 Tax=Aquabacterium sp. TaxID=1872578 RepID=UPI003783A931
MFKRNKLSAAALLAMSSVLSMGAWAQQTQRIEITGSAIKRIDAETSVPVTVIKIDDLKAQGVTSVEQIMQNLSAVQLTVNAAQAIGSGSGGATFADVRGIGQDKTLVLLNGERIANNAVDGSAPDLNMIPFAAIERIEVLRDGASSLYGTDAIGGVINFITKRNFAGGTVSVGYDSPQHPGGKVTSANVGFGYGDLDKQGFNVFGFVSGRKEDVINGMQRDFNKRIVGGLSNSTDPANYTQDFSALYNPAAPGCSGTALIPVNGGTQCKIVTPSFVDFSPKSETISAMVKGTLRVSSALDLGLEAFATQNKVTTQIAPVPYGGYLMNPTMPNGQPNPYYPKTHVDPTFDDGTAGAAAFNPSSAFPHPVDVQPGFVYVFWRDFPNGSRAQTNKNTQSRIMFSADGSAAGWDYSAKVSYNKNQVDQNLVGGYGNGDIIGEGLLEGVINPFGAQSAAGSALLDSALLTGMLQTATGKVTIAKASASRELGDWLGAGRPVQLAIGAEYRKEDFVSKANTPFAELVSASTGLDPTFIAEGKRNVTAVFAEVNVPLMKTLDVTGSVRYDKYSDFGNTTNPKLSFRFQPMKQVLIRGSASTGFRAPTLFELYGSQSYTNTAGNFNNPINCPGGTPIPGASAGANCAVQFQVLNGGNVDLKPEESKNYTLGAVFEPINNLSAGVDFWWLKITNSISSLPQSTLFANYNQFQQYFHFAPGNLLSITSNCPGSKCGYVDQRLQNLGGTNTSGIDLSLQYRLRTEIGQFDTALNSTYVTKYEYQDYQGGPFNQNVGVYVGNGPVFRWQHNLTFNWSKGAFSAGLAAHYKSGYLDFIPTNTVGDFTTVDIFGSWQPIKAATLTFGIRNVGDKAPPFTNQADLFQSGGWDSRFATAIGRTYYVRGSYSF